MDLSGVNNWYYIDSFGYFSDGNEIMLNVSAFVIDGFIKDE